MTLWQGRPFAVALLMAGLALARAWGQVGDSPELPASVGAPAGAGQTAAGPASAALLPKILGWTFSDEVAGKAMRHGDTVSLDPGHPEIIFFFTAGSALLSGNAVKGPLEFRYRLNDYDPAWTVTLNRNAHYRRLAPGKYRFEVQVRGPGQPWPDTLASLPVEQRPFFYQTWYAYLLVLLVVIAVAAQLLHQRDQLLKGQIGVVLDERNRIASDCHDTLMAGFAAVSWQLEAAVRLFGDDDEVRHPAQQSCELARSMVAHCQAEARRIIWDLRNSEEITDVLSHGLRTAIESHRLHGKVPTYFSVEGDELPIAPGAVHHLVCISQEAITNAIHHADATRIDVGLRYDRDTVNLSIRDNGRGFEVSSAAVRTGHFGISVMEERARKLGGALRLSSSALGTEVVIAASFSGICAPMKPARDVLPWIGV